MPRDLAYLNALRALESSARLGSFVRAAEELGVTPAAVGQQVRVLEDYLGRKLFRRTPGGLQASTAASRALAELSDGFDRLEAGFKRLKGPAAGNRLSVSAAPTFAWKWLAPRLQRLYERCPRIDLHLNTSMRLADIAGGEFDIAIRYGREERKGLKSPVFLEEYVLPVCAPGLCETDGCLQTREHLLNLPLLHVEGETSDSGWLSWRDWGVRHDLEGDILDRGPRYSQSAMAIQAALDGQGVALCGLALTIDDLAAGRLVAPFQPGSAVKTRYAYRLVYSANRNPPAIQRNFMRWIMEEATRTQSLMARYLSGARSFSPH